MSFLKSSQSDLAIDEGIHTMFHHLSLPRQVPPHPGCNGKTQKFVPCTIPCPTQLYIQRSLLLLLLLTIFQFTTSGFMVQSDELLRMYLLVHLDDILMLLILMLLISQVKLHVLRLPISE